MHRVIFFVLFITSSISAINWILLNNTCLEIEEQKLDYKGAEELCKTKDLVLYSIKNDWEMNTLKSHLKEKVDYWIGSKRIGGVFKWADGRNCCPISWWGKNEPQINDMCARLILKDNELLIWARSCDTSFQLICSKSAIKVWSLVNTTNYNFGNFCGVEIIPNCEGIPCPVVCDSHPNCDQVVTMRNVCVNIKESSQRKKCVLKMTPNIELYRKVWKCD